MAFDATKREKRGKSILALLAVRQHAGIPELCRELGCSESTLRNDLRDMERHGLVKRVYGGVVPTGNSGQMLGMADRFPAFHREKLAIARHVVGKYVVPGQTMFLDAGTTCAELARLVAELPFRVNVLTNSLDAAHAIAAVDRHVLHLAGGRYDAMHGSFHDHDAMRYLETVHADVFFLCPAGVSVDAGFAGPDRAETELKRMMMRRARRVIALADHSKLNKTGFYSVCALADAEALVTDSHANPDEVKLLKDAGCLCELAPIDIPTP